MTPPIAICNLYPPDYWNLQGVTPLEAPPELWWSSKERKAFEDGLPTSEYLELDFGRIRSFNFLSFNIIQKPITISVEYDVWGYDSGVKRWQGVTRIANERFDDYVSFQSNAANPWKNCQFYFTNNKQDMVSARYLRLKFARRDEPWPNSTISGTFPWSIDLKDLRTSRYVIGLNDTRGIMLQQGKVTAPIHDPVRSIDEATVTMVFEDTSELDEAIVIGVGTPSGVEDYTQAVPEAVDGEIYLAYWASPSTDGIIANVDGYNGLNSLVVNGNAQQSRDGGSLVGYGYDTDTANHFTSDMPEFRVGYAFFLPYPTPCYAWIFAIGTSGMSGGHDAFLRDRASFTEVSGFATLDYGIGHPELGDLIAMFFSIGGDATITDDSALVAAGFTLQDQTATDPTTHIAGYLYTATATGSEGSHWIPPAVTLSASVPWGATIAAIGTPADYNGYLLDSGVMYADPTPAGLTNGPKFSSSKHGDFL